VKISQYEERHHLFPGKANGSAPIKEGSETVKVDWFNPRKLTLFMVPIEGKKQIRDHKGSVRKFKQRFLL
jgi:8-oxo-dGTP diphosphatase